MPAPKDKPKTARRWKRWVIAVAGALALLLFSYPLWLPWGLRPLAANYGIQFAEYQRKGYSRIQLSQVTWSNSTTAVAFERIVVELPHRWLLTRFGLRSVVEDQVHLEGWRIQTQPSETLEEPPPLPALSSGGGEGGVSPGEGDNRQSTGRGQVGQAEGPSQASEINSVPALLDLLQTNLPPLSKWCHRISATNGVLDLAGTVVEVPEMSWREGLLTVAAFDARVSVDLQSLPFGSVSLVASNAQAEAELELKQQADRWVFAGAAQWASNRLPLDGSFDHAGWLPASARAGSDAVALPAQVLGLNGFSELRGNAWLVWTNDACSFDVRLLGEPLSAADWMPDRVSIALSGIAELRALTVRTLAIETPFLNAGLDQPLTMDFSGRVLSGPAALELWADLGQIKAIPLSGQLSGEVRLHPQASLALGADFDLNGTGIGAAGLQTDSVELAGTLNWPALQATNIAVKFKSGGTLQAGLDMDLAARHIERGEWRLEGALPVTLPNAIQLQSVQAAGTLRGTWPELTHSGRMEAADIEAGVFRAGTARLDWTGTGLSFDHSQLLLARGSSRLSVEANGEWSSGADFTKVRVQCTALELDTEVVDSTGAFEDEDEKEGGKWTLAGPVEIRLRRATNRLDLTSSPLELTASTNRIALEARVDWPMMGRCNLSVEGLDTVNLSDFLAADVPRVLLPRMQANVGWDRGPLNGELTADVRWQQTSNAVWSLDCTAALDGEQLRVHATRMSRNGSPVASLLASLPLRIEPTQVERFVVTDADAAARIDFRVLDEGPFWQWITEVTGVAVQQPEIAFRARGPLKAMQGDLTLRASRVDLPQPPSEANLVVSALEKVTANIGVGLDGLVLTQGGAEWMGQRLELTARYDVAAQDWREWLGLLRTPDWRRLSGELELRQAAMSALADAAPKWIAPVGTMDLRLGLQPGLHLDGSLQLSNAATRALGHSAAVRNIQADITLKDRIASVRQFDATLGGRPVSLSGDVEWRSGAEHRFDLALQGENLSLLHQPDLFVRADLDLRLQKEYDRPARLSGDVRLQRSLFFRDFRSLMAVDLARPESRPPYFSVTEEPFAGWELDLRIKGDEFLHIISPAFKGVVSAGLDLSGTLREPVAVGEVVVDSGKVLFPFGTLEVERGRVGLTREDPFRPRLDLRAQGQNFGYSITVDVQGPVDATTLALQSAPPLTTQQILLMLSAGEIPRSDFGYSTADKAGRVGIYVGKEFVNRFLGGTSASERLRLRSGEHITDEGKPTYSIEYELTDRWSAFGEYNRFRDVNSGLRFKVLTR